jgi:hypothetical protein
LQRPHIVVGGKAAEESKQTNGNKAKLAHAQIYKFAKMIILYHDKVLRLAAFVVLIDKLQVLRIGTVLREQLVARFG